jgi:hypothetical protein
LSEYEIGEMRFQTWPGSSLLKLDEALLVRSERLEVLVPENFVCDGASVPAAIWPLLDVDYMQLLCPGIVHDFMYRTGSRVHLDGDYVAPTRVQADVIFRGLVRECGGDWGDAAKCYYGVRVGGASSFMKKLWNWWPGEDDAPHA